MRFETEIYTTPEEAVDLDLVISKAASSCAINRSNIKYHRIIKRSLDTRQKTPKYLFRLELFTSTDEEYLKNIKKIKYQQANPQKKVAIIGAGPAGYFAALKLLEYGIKPVIFERGLDVTKRPFSIRDLHINGQVDENSNYCFGEGGAGTYSDGKLFTRSTKRGDVSKILKVLVENGASEEILYDAQPHIGSNKLPKIIANIRNLILSFGGEVHFSSKMTDLEISNKTIKEIIINNKDLHSFDNVILATGHSASDIYYLCSRKGIYIEKKPFALGFRIEHPQEIINLMQYGKNYNKLLPPAIYKLTTQTSKRAVFSFCMCPGGYIIPTPTNINELVVNGMSNAKRNSKYANSGIVTSINIEDYADFNKYGELAGLKFRETIEKAFYIKNSEHKFNAPAQKLTDFINGKPSTELNPSSYKSGLISAELYNLFPKDISENLQVGLRQIGKNKPLFLSEEANVIGLESRTSSPIRITRKNASYEHINISGLYPVGEGAGYSGGIISSAIDGENAAEEIAKKILN